MSADDFIKVYTFTITDEHNLPYEEIFARAQDIAEREMVYNGFVVDEVRDSAIPPQKEGKTTIYYFDIWGKE